MGAINFGYGDPPKDREKLQQLAEAYQVNYDDLVREAHAYETRPPYIIEMAKNRLHATARLIGSMIETKQIEETLRESEMRFRQIYEHMAVGISQVSLDYIIEHANQAYCQILGYSEEELIGKHLKDITHPETVEANLRRQAQLARGELDHYQMEKKFIHKQGHTVYGILDANLIRGADDAPRYFLGSVLDITARKRMEEELHWKSEAESAIAALSTDLLESVSIDDLSQRVLEQALRLTGSEFGYVGYIDQKTGYLICPTMTRDIWDDCQVPDKDFVFEEFGGLWGWVLENREPLLTNALQDDPRSSGVPAGHLPIRRFLSAPAIIGGELVGQIALANPEEDYTERDLILIKRMAALSALALQRQQAEEEIEHYAAKLERSNEELEQFAYVIAHDLREPARMVKGYLNLLVQRYQGQLDEKADMFIDYAVDGAERMQEMIDALLDLSRIGTRGEEPAPTDAEAVLERTLRALGRAIEDAEAEVTSDPLPTVLADEAQLAQVFQNLIANGIKFRQEDEPPRVHISAEREGDEWVFSVADNGIGIDPKQADRIFQIFQRLHTEEEYPGLGIGLALCKRIVERHGGRIWMESEPGAGSTFYFTLPA